MNHRFLGVAIATSMAMVWLTRGPAAAQTPPAAPKANAAAAAKKWTPPRTPWGEPDLQGSYLEQDHYAVRAAGEC